MLNLLKMAFVCGCCLIPVAMKAQTEVLAFAGSVRSESINKKLVKQAAQIAQELGAKVKVIDLNDYAMPIYEGDLEDSKGAPPAAKKLKEAIDAAQVIMIASPEYNGFFSPLLKNTIDWLSRLGNFKGKTFIIMSTSPGKLGGARALVHLKTLLEELGGQVVSPQVSVPNGFQAFDASGHLKDPKWTNALREAIRPAI